MYLSIKITCLATRSSSVKINTFWNNIVYIPPNNMSIFAKKMVDADIVER